MYPRFFKHIAGRVCDNLQKGICLITIKPVSYTHLGAPELYDHGQGRLHRDRQLLQPGGFFGGQLDGLTYGGIYRAVSLDIKEPAYLLSLIHI